MKNKGKLISIILISVNILLSIFGSINAVVAHSWSVLALVLTAITVVWGVEIAMTDYGDDKSTSKDDARYIWVRCMAGTMVFLSLATYLILQNMSEKIVLTNKQTFASAFTLLMLGAVWYFGLSISKTKE